MSNTASPRRTAVDAPRGTMFMMEPEDLFLVTDEGHPLYDPRVKWAISEPMVASITAKGVIEPVIAKKDGDRVVVIDGRQRTKNALEANKRLRSEGAPTMRVPVIIRREDDAVAFETSVTLNEIREADDVMTKAEKARRLINLGRTEKEVAEAFGVTAVTIRNWLQLFDLIPDARKAVNDGRLSATEAVKQLVKLTREEQAKVLPKVIDSAPKLGRRSKADTSDKPAKKASPVVRLRKIYRDEEMMGALSKREQALIGWIFGKVTKGDLSEAIPRLGELL